MAWAQVCRGTNLLYHIEQVQLDVRLLHARMGIQKTLACVR